MHGMLGTVLSVRHQAIYLCCMLPSRILCTSPLELRLLHACPLRWRSTAACYMTGHASPDAEKEMQSETCIHLDFLS